MSGLLFEGGGYRVLLSAGVVDQALRAAAAAHPIETAGPLFGQLSGPKGKPLDTMLLDEAPIAARHGRRMDVELDGDAVSAMATERWPSAVLLGAWHTHPLGSPLPSRTDVETMRQLVNDPAARCPEAAMVILGGEPSAPRWSAHIVTASNCAPLAEVVVPRPRNTAEAAALGWVECRLCGHRAPRPEKHYFMPPRLICAAQDGDWRRPVTLPWEQPAPSNSVPVFAPPSRTRGSRAR